MLIPLLVLLVASGFAVIVYRITLSPSTPDPIDPASELRWLRRRLRHRPRLARFVRARLDRSTFSGLALSAAFVVVFASALAIGSLLQMETHHSGFARFDQGVADWGAAHVTPGSVRLLRVLTTLGSSAFIVAVVAVVGVASAVRRRRADPAAFLALVVIGQNLLSNGLKAAVGRPRPDVARFVSISGSSFPSGHTTAAAATWAALALVLTARRPRRERAVAGAVAALIAGGVGASRALLGVHWLTDVLAGLVLGWGWFLLVAVVFGGRALRAGTTAEDIAGTELPATPNAATVPDAPQGTDSAPLTNRR